MICLCQATMDTHLQQGEEVLVFILKNIPLLNEWWHQHLNVLLLVQVVAHRVRQGPNRIIQDQKVLGLRGQGKV